MLCYGFTCSPSARVRACVCLPVCVVQQSLSKLPSDKSRSKRNKEPKPRVKKLKYHQYIPPDRKQEPSEVQMDSAYARLLQQQQQFLQLQILSQQQFNFQASPSVNIKYGCFTNTNTPVVDTQGSSLIQLLFVRGALASPPVLCYTSCTMKNWPAVPISCLSCTPSLFLCCYTRPTAEAQSSCSSIVLAGAAAPSHVQPPQSQGNGKPDHLPANLDEMKVRARCLCVRWEVQNRRSVMIYCGIHRWLS